ncbi:MAG: amidohydrolase family protein, partial [Chloroflexota bacterium]
MRTIFHPEWLIDGTGAEPLTNHALVVSGGRVEAVTPSHTIEARDDDQVVSLPNATLLPGLINNHVHLNLRGDNTPFWDVNQETDVALTLRSVHNAQTSLRAGVTTVRDCGARGTIAIEVRDAQARGLVEGARIISGGWPITITGGHLRNFGGEADGEDALRRMVRRKVSVGVDFIKVMASGGGTPGTLPHYPSFSVAELRVIVESAHALGKRVVAHCTCTAAIENAVTAHVDFIEHAMFSAPTQQTIYDPRVAELLAKSGIAVTPTLQVFRDLVDLLPDSPERSNWQVRHAAHENVVRDLHALGVPLLAGSDAGWRATAFDTFWKELDELVICGLTPVQAIHAATGAIGKAWGYNHFSTLEVGRAADLVVVTGDASRDIKRLASVQAVYQAGV